MQSLKRNVVLRILVMDIQKIEYTIRRYERGLSVLLLSEKRAGPHTKEEYGYAIQSYAVKIAALKKELKKLTGRCTPSIPRWPI